MAESKQVETLEDARRQAEENLAAARAINDELTELRTKLNLAERTLQNKTKQFENLLGLYNLIVEKIITSGTQQ